MWNTSMKKDTVVYSAKFSSLVASKQVSGSWVMLPFGYEAPLDTFKVRTIQLADKVFVAALWRDMTGEHDLNDKVHVQITLE